MHDFAVLNVSTHLLTLSVSPVDSVNNQSRIGQVSGRAAAVLPVDTRLEVAIEMTATVRILLRISISISIKGPCRGAL